MARRQPWDSLKADYRNRLIKRGITRESHAAGASIKAARGHEHTPEHGPSLATLVRKLKEAELWYSDLNDLKEKFGTRGTRALLKAQLKNYELWKRGESPGWVESGTQFRGGKGPDLMRYYSEHGGDGELFDPYEYRFVLFYMGR